MSTNALMPATGFLLEPDPRGRVSIQRVSSRLAERYVAHEEPGGVIVLEPAVVMTEAQARLNAMPELLETIASSRKLGRDGVAHRPRRTS